jgi:hypothetical protein
MLKIIIKLFIFNLFKLNKWVEIEVEIEVEAGHIEKKEDQGK